MPEFIDDDDRTAMALSVVLFVMAAIAITVGAAVLGLAWSAFRVMEGLV